MNKLIRFWNQNRKVIIVGIVVVALLILFIQVLNQIAKKSNEKRENEIASVTEEEKQLPTTSIIGGDKINVEEAKNNTQIINIFIEKCNNNDIEGAYQMITDGCKTSLFPTFETFRDGYYNIIFKEKRIADIQNFDSSKNLNTYLVKFYSDVLEMGNTENKESYQDYITIDRNETEEKISIASLICRKEINKSNEIEGIKVTIVAQEIFKEFERYEINIENDTNKRILMDTRKKTKSIYLVDKKGTTYNSFLSEISNALCEIPAYFDRTYKIRFNKIYSNNIESKGIVFSDIVDDCETYKEDANSVTQRIKISVEI